MFYLGIFKIEKNSTITKKVEFFDLSTLGWWSRWGLEQKISDAAINVKNQPIPGKWVAQNNQGYRYIALIPINEHTTRTALLLQKMQVAIAKGDPNLEKVWNDQIKHVNTGEKIMQDLADIRIALQNSVTGLLRRGEKLEDLDVKSSVLVTQSKALKQKSSKLNCCIGWWFF